MFDSLSQKLQEIISKTSANSKLTEDNMADALREIRKFSNVPALFLTAKTAESDKADAYHNGGDDYLSKPFSQSELLMKVTSLVRRYREYGNSLEHIKNIDSLKSIRIDADRHIVYKNEVDVGLTDTEYILLNFLI